MFSLIFTAQLV